MANAFFAELWESIFTPGPSPVLLKAANGTFAALQVILFIMLLMTHSLHFVALSVICAGLWVGVNWFSAELTIAMERQRAAEREQAEDSETEVEPSAEVPGVRSEGAEVPEEQEGLRRRDAGPGTQSSASTEDEWEKVSETENDKQK